MQCQKRNRDGKRCTARTLAARSIVRCTQSPAGPENSAVKAVADEPSTTQTA
jgi:hypothetical protein